MKPNQQRPMLAAPAVLANVRLVLVEPQTPANIGAVARAMKTMGLSDLALVRPSPWRESREAWYIAHGAEEVLQDAQEHDTLDAAIAPLRLVAGTTNRRRTRVHPDPEPPDTAAARLIAAAQGGPVGVLFGNEDTGLSSADLSRCSLVITIPSAVERPSLNLSHAVQVVAYELFRAAAGDLGPPAPDLAPAVELEALCARILRLMRATGFHFRQHDPETFLASVRRCFGRAAFERRDLRTMHLILATVERVLRERRGGVSPESRLNTKNPKDTKTAKTAKIQERNEN